MPSSLVPVRSVQREGISSRHNAYSKADPQYHSQGGQSQGGQSQGGQSNAYHNMTQMIPDGPEEPPAEIEEFSGLKLASRAEDFPAETLKTLMIDKTMLKLPKLVMDAKQAAQTPTAPNNLPGKNALFVTIGVLTRQFEAKVILF